MSVAEDVRDYLATNLPGEDIRVGGLPEDTDVCIAVNETQLAGPMELVMGSTPGERVSYRKPVVQVLVRDARDEHEAVRTRAQAVHALLIFATDVVQNGSTYDMILARSEPFPLTFDTNERPLFACNYECWKRGI